jgi:hypothetical protein
VTQNERQCALANAAEPDEDDASRKLDVNFVGHYIRPIQNRA